jgi:hypothetical protein
VTASEKPPELLTVSYARSRCVRQRRSTVTVNDSTDRSETGLSTPSVLQVPAPIPDWRTRSGTCRFDALEPLASLRGHRLNRGDPPSTTESADIPHDTDGVSAMMGIKGVGCRASG